MYVFNYRKKVRRSGWLILTESSLKWYELMATHSMGKPTHMFDFESTGCTFALVPSVDDRSIPPGMAETKFNQTFTVRKHEADSLEEIAFVATSIEDKVEWLEAIGQVLHARSDASKIKSAFKIKSESSKETCDLVSPASKAKELKAVSIVPVRKDLMKSAADVDASRSPAVTPSGRKSRRSVSTDNRDLDLSIRSSMFGSPSDTSFI